MAVKMTLALVRDGDRLLLGRKKRGFGMGKWNGFGGKVHDGETFEQAARRELTEEAGIVAGAVRKFAELRFSFADGAFDDIHAHVFEVVRFSGEPCESDEMCPQWFSLSEIPYAEMWDDDKFWFPLFLDGKSFVGSFSFRDGKVVSHDIEERPV